MGENSSRDPKVSFILVSDPQAFSRLLPIVSALALSEPVEEEPMELKNHKTVPLPRIDPI